MPDTTSPISMDEREIARMIGAQRRAKPAGRGWRCPSAEQVAAYLEQRLVAEDKARFEAHLAHCDFCLGLIGSLVREPKGEAQVEVPAYLVRQAIESVPEKTSSTGLSWRWALVPALATIIVASAVLLKSPQPARLKAPELSAPADETAVPPPVSNSQSRPGRTPRVRSLKTPAPGPQLLEPRSGSALPAAGLRLRWKAVADAVYYEVQVVNSEGDPAWGAETRDAIAQTPDSLSLRTGKYFVWVRAHMRDGRTLKSDTIGFRIVNPVSFRPGGPHK